LLQFIILAKLVLSWLYWFILALLVSGINISVHSFFKSSPEPYACNKSVQRRWGGEQDQFDLDLVWYEKLGYKQVSVKHILAYGYDPYMI